MGRKDTWRRGLCHTFCKDKYGGSGIFFFISTQKDVRGYQKVALGKINHKNAKKSCQIALFS